MYKKACCTCKVVVFLIKPIAFMTFLLPLPSPSSDLKFPFHSCSLYLIWYPVLTLGRGRYGYDITLLRAMRGARNPNLQVVITHASHVCGQHSLELPLRMNGMHKTQLNVQRCCLPNLLLFCRSLCRR